MKHYQFHSIWWGTRRRAQLHRRGGCWRRLWLAWLGSARRNYYTWLGNRLEWMLWISFIIILWMNKYSLLTSPQSKYKPKDVTAGRTRKEQTTKALSASLKVKWSTFWKISPKSRKRRIWWLRSMRISWRLCEIHNNSHRKADSTFHKIRYKGSKKIKRTSKFWKGSSSNYRARYANSNKRRRISWKKYNGASGR